MTPDLITSIHETEYGHIVIADSMTYFPGHVGADDILITGSYSARTTFALPLRLGVKGVIAHDAGIGKDEAGISGLLLADKCGMPGAAADSSSARLADGESVWAGQIGRANETAKALGVEPGQPVSEAARLMLAAPPGKKTVVEKVSDPNVYELEQNEKGNIRALQGLPVLETLEPPRSQDVIIQCSHTGHTLIQPAIHLGLRGIIANDAGRGLDDSGVGCLGPLAEAGIAAAAVSAMSARIGDLEDTWRNGIISVANQEAEARGVRPGMTTMEAARKMLEEPW